MRRKNLVKLLATTVAAGLLATVGWVTVANAAGGPNLSLGKPTAVSSTNGGFVSSNLNDGNQGSYWESVGISSAQWARIDLGTPTAIDQVVLKLPSGWGTRTQTLSVQSSNDGVSFANITTPTGHVFNQSSSNVVTINFGATTTRYVRVNITANTGWAAAQLSEFEIYGVASATTNLAAGKPTSESGHADVYGAGNVVDGNQSTYWESVNNSFPEWATVDLGATVNINKVVLKLPTSGWGTRTQTLSVQGSTTGSTFTDIVASATYTFNPAVAGNSVTITFGQTSQRYVRINITANSAWPAGQLSELEVYGPGAGTDTTPPSVPGTLSYSTSGTTITLNWGASTDNAGGSGLAGYDIYRNGTLATSVGNVTTWADTQPTSATVSYYVRARDNAGNQSGNSNTVTRTGTSDTTPPTVPGTLSYTVSGTTITLNWGASTDTGGSGLAGYDLYRNGSFWKSVGLVTTTTDDQPASATVSYYVRAKDGAGNLSGNSNTVTRTGSDTTAPTTPGTLSYTQSGTTITLNWGASTDTGGSGLAGYNVYRDGNLVATLGTVLTYQDTQPTTVTVSYYVRARDGAGNLSGNSNTVVRNGTTPPGSNVALNKPVTSTGHTFTFAPENAVDGNLTTYFEGSGAYPQNLTVALGANHTITAVNVKLNPDPAWGTRVQNIQVLGRDQASSTYTSLKAAQDYTFTQGNNVVSIAVSAAVADVQLRFSSNSGAPGGQVAEFEVIGTPAPNPDLTVTNVAWSPASPNETAAITLSATVNNIGEVTSAATQLKFYLGTTLAGTANVGSIAAGGSQNISLNIGAKDAGSYTVSAKVDENNAVIEKNETNNTGSAGSALVVTPVQSSDLVPVVSTSPSNPAAGNTVTLNVGIRNQGNVASTSGGHGITLTLLNDAGATVITRTGTFTGTINAGATSSFVNLGTWTAVNGRYTIRVVIAVDGNEVASKQANNTADTGFFVGRGANMPYDMYEAEDGQTGGGAVVLSPNRTIGDLAGEASGRRAVTLPSVGSYVQWTSKASTNTVVIRASIPDSSGGTGQTGTLSIYVNGTFHKKITMTSKYSWVYGAEASPNNSPGSGGPRHIYDDANIMLDQSFPAGSVIKLQRDSGDSLVTTVDFMNLEQVTAIANPDPARYITPASTSQNDVQAAFDQFRMSTNTNLLGVYLPAGTYPTQQKFTVYGKAIQVVGAGPWYTRFVTPQDQENTNAGFDVQSSASGSTFKNLSFWGNYTIRQDGPGKVWGEFKDVDNLTIDNTWVEHTVCSYWGVSVAGLKYTNGRIRNTWADGINMTSDSTGALISNVDARSNGDDAFALFSAIDGGGSVGNNGNVFENLSATLTWRAAGLAVYGGFNNVFRNMYIADQLTYAGITISSLDFGYPFVGFGSSPTTRFENISIVRAGGHFWGNQVFPAIWCFSASKEFRGIRVSDVDIIDPTYGGVMFQTKYTGSTPEFSVTDTIFTNIRISGAVQSGDQYNAKSGWGIWANEMPEAGQGPARGSATFNNVTFSNVFQNVRNTTSTFTITINP